MSNEPLITIVILYEDFKRLSAKQRQDILNIDDSIADFLVYIKNKDYEKLNNKEKKNLEGFKRTEKEPLRKEIIATEIMFKLPLKTEIPEIKDNISPSFKEKHKKASKPYCPKNIINKNFNSKKKGGR